MTGRESGKSALIARYLHDSFTETYTQTYIVDFVHRVVEQRGRRFKVRIGGVQC